jgi:hypothetical protein
MHKISRTMRSAQIMSASSSSDSVDAGNFVSLYLVTIAVSANEEGHFR